MRLSAVLWLVCSGLMLLTGGNVMGQPRFGELDGDAARYGWGSSLTEAKSKAQKSGKPIMVVVRCVP